jgi:hypothetical protein
MVEEIVLEALDQLRREEAAGREGTKQHTSTQETPNQLYEGKQFAFRSQSTMSTGIALPAGNQPVNQG